MPTLLPRRRPNPPEPKDSGPRDPGFRDIMIAGALLLSTLGLVCEKFYPPTPGYSLARSHHDLQLSP